MRAMSIVTALLFTGLAGGCSDRSSITPPGLSPSSASANRNKSERYVAIGTSISMGWRSNGVYDASQRESWPAIMAFGNVQGITLPLIQAPGCTSPIIAPLAAGTRLSGESISGSTVCAPNDPGVVLPTQNVGLAGALALDVVNTTPEATSLPWFARVLPPHTTALAAALSQNPSIVSVELGGNELLNATSGLVQFGVTIVPLPYFIAPYDAILDAIGTTGANTVLAGVPADGRNFPALRRGDEIWADRAEFAALHVDVSNDCEGSENYINVSIKSLNMVFTGAFTSSHGLPNPVYSCADIPGTADLVLTPADITLLNGLLAQMSDHIRGQAAARGYAYFSLGALYDMPGIKGGPYSVINQLTSSNPYGPFVSLDGIHPNAAGNAVIAHAAAVAINTTYGGGAHVLTTAPGSSLASRMVEPVAPALALSQARAVAAAHAGETLSACTTTGGCDISRRITSK